MTERFDCRHCEDSLFGRKYVLREERPYCVACFEALFASTCEECGNLIGCDCKVPGPWASPSPVPPALPRASQPPWTPALDSPRTTRFSARLCSRPGPHQPGHSAGPSAGLGPSTGLSQPPPHGRGLCPSQSRCPRSGLFQDVCAEHPRSTCDGPVVRILIQPATCRPIPCSPEGSALPPGLTRGAGAGGQCWRSECTRGRAGAHPRLEGLRGPACTGASGELVFFVGRVRMCGCRLNR